MIFHDINIVSATFSQNDGRLYHSYNDEPAVIYLGGAREWYKEGQLHRDDDKPALVYKDGTKIWYKNGIVHRSNGPAIMWYKDKYLKTYVMNGRIINPSRKQIKYPKTDEEKLSHIGQCIFIYRNQHYFLFNEYIEIFDKDFYSKYKMLIAD